LVPLIGSSLFPPAETPYFLVQVTTSEGSAIPATARAVDVVENALKDEGDVQAVMSNIGRGNPQIFYNQRNFDQRSNIGEVLVTLKRWDKTAGPALVERLRAKLAAAPDAQYVVKVFQNGPPIDAPIQMRIIGPELDVLKRLATEVEAVMRAVPGTRDIKNPVAVDQLRLNLGLDSDKAALLGVAPGAPRRTLRLALTGETAGRFRDVEGDSYNVVVRLPLADRHSVTVLDDIYLPGSTGAVPLRQIATPYLDSAPPRINRERQSRVVYVDAQVAEGFLTA
jgi:multidrug efflux pump subunit AcrB